MATIEVHIYDLPMTSIYVHDHLANHTLVSFHVWVG